MKKIIAVLLMVVTLFGVLQMHVNATTSAWGQVKHPFYGDLSAANTMPTHGQVKTLVLLVDFQDIAHEEKYTADSIEEKLFRKTKTHTEDMTSYYLESELSLREYYHISSYGQLDLNGDVYGWYTAQNERDYYNNSTGVGVKGLLQETLDYYAEQIDLDDYDADEDGCVDGVYLLFAGATTSSSATTWWHHVQSPINVTQDDKKVTQLLLSTPGAPTSTLTHETGHLLGLDDYYGSGNYFQILQENDKMCSDTSIDHNAFSKYLLGWINEDNGLVSVAQEQKVTLTSVNKTTSMAIIYPENNMDSSSYLVVEYNTRVGVNFDADGCLRIWRVNGVYSETNNWFETTNRTGSNPLICAVATPDKLTSARFHTGDSLSAYGASSSFLRESYTNIFSGINIDNILIENGVATFDVSYSEQKQTHTYDEINVTAGNTFAADIEFSSETLRNSSLTPKILDTAGNTILTLSVYELQGREEAYATPTKYCMTGGKDALTPGGTYVLYVPEGTFTDIYGVKQPEIEYTFTVDQYLQEEETLITENSYTRLFPAINMTSYVDFFALKDNDVYRVRWQDDGTVTEQQTDIVLTTSTPYQLASGVLENGNYVLSVSPFSGNSEIFVISPDGKIIASLSAEIGDVRVLGNRVFLLKRNETTKGTVYDANLQELYTKENLPSKQFVYENGLVGIDTNNNVELFDKELNHKATGTLTNIQNISSIIDFSAYGENYRLEIVTKEGVCHRIILDSQLQMLESKDIGSFDLGGSPVVNITKKETGGYAGTVSRYIQGNSVPSGSWTGYYYDILPVTLFFDANLNRVSSKYSDTNTKYKTVGYTTNYFVCMELTSSGAGQMYSVEVVCPEHVAESSLVENIVLPTATDKGCYDEVVYCSVCTSELSRTTRPLAAIVSGRPYSDIATAFNSAQSGETVQLMEHVDGRADVAFVIPSSVTVDLNGYTITAKNFLSFGTVIDSTEGVGGIVISNDTAKAYTNLQPDNAYMPLYDTTLGRYRFFSYSVISKGTKEAAGYVKFGVAPVFTNSKAYEFLLDETNENMSFELELTVRKSTGTTQPLTYKFRYETLKAYASGMINDTANVIVLTVSGIDSLANGSTITGVGKFSSVTGVMQTGEPIVYTKQA